MILTIVGLQLTFSLILPLLHEGAFGVRELDIKPWIQESKLLAIIPAPTPIAIPKPIQLKPTKQVDLNIRLRNQIYSLSCESASLQMALEHYGIIQNQDQILKEIGIAEPYKSYIDANGDMIWGDPELGFVGNVRGLFSVKTLGMRGATGWGVNKNPIARVAQMHRPNSQAYTGFTANDVAVELDNGNPVIIWFVPDSYSAGSVTYKTPLGRSVRFFRNHVALVSGYKIIGGETWFDIADPLYGKYSIKKATLDRRMAKYDGDVVVVR